MKLSYLSLVGSLCVASAHAQVPFTPAAPGHVEPSVLAPIGGEPGVDALRVELARARLDGLARRDALTFTGVPLPDGSFVDVDLVRIRHERLGFAFTVDGVARPGLLDGLDLSLWKGSVRGAPDSEVQLSFANTGAQGWIRRGQQLVHVLPRPDAGGDWTRGDTLLVDEAVLNQAGLRFDGTCQALEVPGAAEERGGPLTRAASVAPGGGTQHVVGACSQRGCSIAITTDFQYYQRFNNLGVQTAYTTTLLGFISDRYETQANTLLIFPSIAFYTTSNDPWSTPETGGDSVDMLYELQAAWVGNVPADATLGHMLSGASLGGGVAWLNVLCSNTNNFSVVGNMNGNTPFPVGTGPNNWDFMASAHEIGHNFDALHTHDYCPPLDQCAPSGYFGQCQSAQVCTNQGTIMSYCHLCSGGTSNIVTSFHPSSAADMTAAAIACLPFSTGLSTVVPDVVAPNTPTPVSVTVTGTPVGPVQVLWRPDAATAYAAIDLVNSGGGVYTGTLPAFACGDEPSFYFTMTDASCGSFTNPAGAPANAHDLEIVVAVNTFVDDFQTNLGWTATNLGATAGSWQRGVPVNDSGWDYDPQSDGDGSGSCWLTQNTLGNSDVDGGSVELLSPPIDLSSPDAVLEYLYFLRLTATDGSDGMVVEAANGPGGPWAVIAVHTTNGGLAWRTERYDRADFLASGITPGATVRLRFTASDFSPGHIVEAGLDGVRVTANSCTVVGANYCTANPNSSGGPAVTSATGSASVAANDLVLSAAPVPGSSNGIFFFGPTTTQVPFGNGIRCVGGSTLRLGIVTASSNALTRVVNNAAPPAAGNLVAGSTWYFQAWFRDVAAGGSNFNLSTGLRIPFTP